MKMAKTEISNQTCYVIWHQNADSICFFKKNSVEWRKFLTNGGSSMQEYCSNLTVNGKTFSFYDL